MNKTYILVADQGRARLFLKMGATMPAREIENYINTEGHRKTRDLVSDAPGRTHSSHPHPMTRENAAIEHHLQVFARDLVASLDYHLYLNPNMDLVLICAPRLLGFIRSLLKPKLRKRIIKEIPKDITSWKLNAIDSFINEHS